VLLAACGARPGDVASFAVSYPNATAARAKLGAKFYAKPEAHCAYDNGREAHWAITGAHVVSGELPPGIAIEDGALTGTPTKAGDYAARLEVSGVTCAGKPYPDQNVDIRITAR
jgi:hypothetical protein